MCSYLNKVQSEHNFSVQKSREIAKAQLPDYLRSKPWNGVPKHGITLLENEDQMNAYLAAYGEMHEIKCKATMQNFKFDTLITNFEIVDWGCGQGIATMSLVEMLKERGLLGRLKRVTLIEPSIHTLSRAEQNVRKILGNMQVEISAINLWLPSSYQSAETVDSQKLNFTYPCTIHLFSNILDIPLIDLRKTACIIISSGRKHVIACCGPTNDNKARIDEFCELLNAKDYFSDIDLNTYGYTTDTNHPFSCKSKGFVIENTSATSLNQYAVLNAYDESGSYDDYDNIALARNGQLSERFLRVYNSISQQLNDNDRIFIKPSIGLDMPDIMVVRPQKGILLVKVYEESLYGKVLKNKAIRDLEDNELSASPISTLLAYKDNLEINHCQSLFIKKLIAPQAYYITKTLVCFTENDQAYVDGFCKDEIQHLSYSTKKCVTVIGNDGWDKNIWTISGLNNNNSTFDGIIKKEILDLVTSTWHSYKEGRLINLTAAQRDLAKSESGRHRKIKGFAGSGKTEVLASHAVNSYLRTGRSVLILTYNKTLRNHIRYRLNQVPADFLWSHFVISTYYSFFTDCARNANRKLALDSYVKEDFFTDEEKLPKYSAILVDEVQDYEESWLKILKYNFLEPDGEFLVFGDEKQNVYNRPLEKETKLPKTPIPGAWNILKKCHRSENQSLVRLALEFQTMYMPELPQDDIDLDTRLNFDGPSVDYINLGYTTDIDLIGLQCMKSIESISFDENVAILSPTCEILTEVEYYLRVNGKTTTIMCETQEEKSNIMSKDVADAAKKEMIQDIRENKKQHFTMMSEGIKLSTIQSFKGWGADNIILIIPNVSNERDYRKFTASNRDLNPNMIYTGITRATRKITIISLGNLVYDKFFKNFGYEL